MSANYPDFGTIRAALTLATRAPSVHNSQPWRWRVGPDRLHLYANPSPGCRHLPSTDRNRRGTVISCGTTLHHCAVALAAMGWHTIVARLPDPADIDHLAAITINRQTPDELDVTLAAAIDRRRTDRRNYSSRPVPWGDIALMGARAARAGVMLRQVAGSALHEPPQSLPGGNDAMMVALGTEADDDLARLRAGEATSLVLLSATAMGLASCPVTEPLENPLTREAMRADVFGTSGYPQMLLSVGWAPVSADPLPAAPRRPLAEVVDWPLDAVFTGFPAIV